MRKSTALRAVPAPKVSTSPACPFSACQSCNPRPQAPLPPLSRVPLPAPVRTLDPFTVAQSAGSIISEDIARLIDDRLNETMCFYAAPDSLYDAADRDPAAKAALDAAADREQSIHARIRVALSNHPALDIRYAVESAVRAALNPEK